jgi:hypothetical protein
MRSFIEQLYQLIIQDDKGGEDVLYTEKRTVLISMFAAFMGIYLLLELSSALY